MPQFPDRIRGVAVGLKESRRLCYPLVVAGGVRAIGAVWLYAVLSSDGRFHTGWADANISLIPAASNWLWLFNAWDSLQFPLIARFGYDHPNYVRLPGYPLLIRVAAVLTGNYWLGAFIVTQVFAFASIVMFQLLAEEYMQPREALHAALLMATFPFIFIFMTLSYSESVFLFSSIAAWYFYRKERMMLSSLFAGLASVTKGYGVLIVLPTVLSIVREKRYRKLLYEMIPLALIGSWLGFCFIVTGDPFVSWTDEKYWTHGMSGDAVRLFQAIWQHGLSGVVKCCSGLDPTIFWAVGLFAILAIGIWHVDHYLWAYAISLSALLIFTAPFYISLLRFLAFIFPVWLTVKVKNSLVAAVCVAFFIPLSLIVWLFVLQVTFIG